jgi:hypothetical protein
MKSGTHNATPVGVAPHPPQCIDCGNVYHIAQGHRCAYPRDEYEADVAKRPLYHDGKPRKTWGQLSDIARWSWGR